MKAALKQLLKWFPKLRRQLSSIRWVLLLATTAMIFLGSTSLSGCAVTISIPGLDLPQITDLLTSAAAAGPTLPPTDLSAAAAQAAAQAPSPSAIVPSTDSQSNEVVTHLSIPAASSGGSVVAGPSGASASQGANSGATSTPKPKKKKNQGG